jgi:hypothetical protein
MAVNGCKTGTCLAVERVPEANALDQSPTQRDSARFEFEQDVPSELLCLPNTVPRAPIVSHEERARSSKAFAKRDVVDEIGARHVLFTREIEDLFRQIIASTLPPIEQARVLRVMPLFPAGVPLQVVSGELFRALPTLPGGLEYRFHERDLLIVDLNATEIVDAIWLVIGGSRS